MIIMLLMLMMMMVMMMMVVVVVLMSVKWWQHNKCHVVCQVDYNDVEDESWYDDIECDDENDDDDQNEGVFNDDDDEACRAQMLTKLVFIARQDARIQQAFDIYDHREDDNGDKGGLQ